ncbi:MAG: HypC/HybG/HupF family hydrogenase formation chaperone, partial [Candidatus Thorarchaeota archaeon]
MDSVRICLVIPARVLSIDGDFAEVDFGGAIKLVCVTLLPCLEVGEYGIIYT